MTGVLACRVRWQPGGGVERLGARHQLGARHPRLATARPSRSDRCRGLGPDQATPLLGIFRVQQLAEGHIDVAGVAVERLPIGEGQLGALDDQVDEVGRVGLQRAQVVTRQQLELL